MSAATEFDVGPLTWVKGEIDLALQRAEGRGVVVGVVLRLVGGHAHAHREVLVAVPRGLDHPRGIAHGVGVKPVSFKKADHKSLSRKAPSAPPSSIIWSTMLRAVIPNSSDSMEDAIG